MTDQASFTETVVVAVDGSASSYHAVAWAAVDAALHRRRLHLVNSIALPEGYGPGPILTETDVDWIRLEGERVLGEAARVARAATGEDLDLTSELVREPIVGALIERSRTARTLVVGSRGLGAFRRGLLGSVSAAVTRHAHCPVAVIHGMSATDTVSADRPVLVGVDGSPNSVPAVELAFQEASLRKVGVVALHAWSDVSGFALEVAGWNELRAQEDRLLAESLAGYGERYPEVRVRRVVVYDRPVRALLEESERAQLVVVGSHGRGGFTGMLLGSTSSALSHTVECPILVVREE